MLYFYGALLTLKSCVGFFFQAEDGIRDGHVTGVQTCALPIARKGAGDAFDELMRADARWRELETEVTELRAKTKLKGKPTPEQLDELRGVKERLSRLEEEHTQAARLRDEALTRVPNPPHES